MPTRAPVGFLKEFCFVHVKVRSLQAWSDELHAQHGKGWHKQQADSFLPLLQGRVCVIGLPFHPAGLLSTYYSQRVLQSCFLTLTFGAATPSDHYLQNVALPTEHRCCYKPKDCSQMQGLVWRRDLWLSQVGHLGDFGRVRSSMRYQTLTVLGSFTC